MRKMNSTFQTTFLSEEGSQLQNRDYFAFVELDGLACYVIADGLDDDRDHHSAELAVTAILARFTENPSMSKRSFRQYLLAAHRALGELDQGMQLKAAVTVVITNYIKYRYCVVGNSRFAVFRNDRLIIQSVDQSLTSNLVKQERLGLDKAALHEERNNLYAYLGMKGLSQFAISPKLTFEDGDIALLYTRGLWEHCDEGELIDCVIDAKSGEEIINNAEELVLAKQPPELDNYTLAVTFIDKIYRKPNKKWTWRKILMIALPILIILITITVFLLVRRNKRVQQVSQMNAYIESAEKYSSYDNYMKAAGEYGEALKLANALKRQETALEVDQLKKLMEQILLADEATKQGDYKKAEDAYYKALDLSAENGNIGKQYLETQLSKNNGMKDVFDLLEQGDQLLELEDSDGARACYQEAKALAGQIFFQEGKQEAIDKIAMIDQQRAADKKDAKAQEDAKKAEEEKQKEAAATQQKEAEELAKEAAAKAEEEAKAKEQERLSAIDIEKQGNSYFDLGDYTNALLYYHTAREMYLELEITARYDAITEKIILIQELAGSAVQTKTQEEIYVEAAGQLASEKNYQEAARLYELAIDSYRTKGNAAQLNLVEQKLKEITPFLKN